MSFYQSDVPRGYFIDLFYAFNYKKEGAYVEEIMAMPKRDALRGCFGSTFVRKLWNTIDESLYLLSYILSAKIILK